MEKISWLLVVGYIFVVLLIQVKLANQPLLNNDEVIYETPLFFY